MFISEYNIQISNDITFQHIIIFFDLKEMALSRFAKNIAKVGFLGKNIAKRLP